MAFPDNFSPAAYTRAWETDHAPSEQDMRDIATLRQAIEATRAYRTLLRGLPQLQTARTDIYTPEDVDAEMAEQIGQLMESVAMLERGA